jgi:hypothetical protein
MGWIKKIDPEHDCEDNMPDADDHGIDSIYECDHCNRWWRVARNPAGYGGPVWRRTEKASTT